MDIPAIQKRMKERQKEVQEMNNAPLAVAVALLLHSVHFDIRTLIGRVERLTEAFKVANQKRHHAESRADDLAAQRNSWRDGFQDMQRKRNELEVLIARNKNQWNAAIRTLQFEIDECNEQIAGLESARDNAESMDDATRANKAIQEKLAHRGGLLVAMMIMLKAAKE
jgi:chromosome segregation ATPase